MSVSLIQVIVALTKVSASLPSSNAPFAGTSVVVTDPVTGAQPAVVLTGVETPTAWAFPTSVNPGAGSVTATDLDTSGNPIGSPVTQAFTEAGTPATFQQTTGISVTPASAAAVAALRTR